MPYCADARKPVASRKVSLIGFLSKSYGLFVVCYILVLVVVFVIHIKRWVGAVVSNIPLTNEAMDSNTNKDGDREQKDKYAHTHHTASTPFSFHAPLMRM